MFLANMMDGIDLNNHGCQLNNEHRYAEAVPVFKRSVAIKVATYGEDSVHTCISLSGLADAYLGMLDLDNAEREANRMMTIAAKVGSSQQKRIANEIIMDIKKARLKTKPHSCGDKEKIKENQTREIEEHKYAVCKQESANGKLLRCSRCKKRRFCGRDCQQKASEMGVPMALLVIVAACVVPWLLDFRTPFDPAAKKLDAPGRMKAIVHYDHGLPSALQLVETETPGFLPHQVLIRVHAASVNPVDYKMLGGFIPWWAEAFMRIPNPTPVGFDVAGVIVGVGASVDLPGLQVDARVYAMADVRYRGTFAEYVAVAAHRVAPMPVNVDFVEAASIPLASLTNWQALVQIGAVEPEQRVLILGGSGGTGTSAIQMAKALGCKVATTCSARNHAMCTDLGADVVIDYKKENFGDVLEGQEYDLVYDCVGGAESWSQSKRVLKAGGRYVTIVGDSPANLGVGELLRKGYAIVTRTVGGLLGLNPHYSLFTCFGEGAALRSITELVQEGKLKSVLDSTLEGLEKTQQAFEKSRSGAAQGKIVVNVVG